MQRDINGAPRAIYGRGYPIGLNNPDARQYVLGLLSDLAANYDGSEFPMLRAVREGLRAAKANLPSVPARTSARMPG